MSLSKVTNFLLVVLLMVTSIGAIMADYRKMIPSHSTSGSAKGERQESIQVNLVPIKMNGYRFVPDKIEIERGTTVQWINAGRNVHTVTDAHSSWDSGNLKPGEEFSHRFEEKGTFKYYCIPHQDIGMTGTITVK